MPASNTNQINVDFSEAREFKQFDYPLFKATVEKTHINRFHETNVRIGVEIKSNSLTHFCVIGDADGDGKVYDSPRYVKFAVRGAEEALVLADLLVWAGHQLRAEVEADLEKTAKSHKHGT